MQSIGWIIAAAGAAFFAWFGKDSLPIAAAALGVTPKGPPNYELARALAMKWGPIFGCPIETILVICKIESAYRAHLVNTNARALQRGGAWGMMQQTLETAKGHAIALRGHTHPGVQATLRKFDGTGQSLLDADLNVMFGAYQLGKLHREFGSFEAAAAGYHQGAGKVRTLTAQGRAIVPDNLPPNGKIYLGRAMSERSKLA